MVVVVGYCYDGEVAYCCGGGVRRGLLLWVSRFMVVGACCGG